MEKESERAIGLDYVRFIHASVRIVVGKPQERRQSRKKTSRKTTAVNTPWNYLPLPPAPACTVLCVLKNVQTFRMHTSKRTLMTTKRRRQRDGCVRNTWRKMFLLWLKIKHSFAVQRVEIGECLNDWLLRKSNGFRREKMVLKMKHRAEERNITKEHFELRFETCNKKNRALISYYKWHTYSRIIYTSR